MEEKSIQKEVILPASIDDVWNAWTTREGIKTFFAPDADIELTIGGKYEIYFNPEKPWGEKGGEDLRVLSFIAKKMLSFSWSAPPWFPNVRNDTKTWVVITLKPVNTMETVVKIVHLGWKEGNEWNEVYNYFQEAWEVVLARLEYSFREKSIDWSNPYRPMKDE